MMELSPKRTFKDAFEWDLILMTWIPILIITILHYTMPSRYHWVHDILRRLYYLPLIYASIRGGLRCGLFSAILIIVLYFPHAFMHLSHYDPARGVEKVMEMLLYLGAAYLGGFLSNREKSQGEEVKKMLIQQKNLIDQLVRAGRLSALGEVVAGIAHEIKNPLHALLGTAEIIDPLIPKDVPERKMWENHRDELKRLKRTSERFLSFARPSAPNMDLVDMGDVAQRLEGLIGAECRQRSIKLDLSPSKEPYFVRGDSDQLSQIVLNIVLNGLNAMEKTGDTIKINVSRVLQKDSKMVLFSISNNGPQIPDDSMEAIFNPFFTSGNGGTGLGLSIASQLARQHRGYIEVNNSDVGVVFSIFIPAAKK
jgi:signal transduction histidine kinase